jgi:HPt (histidine-containing phosphotransfer) domain-containing protein
MPKIVARIDPDLSDLIPGFLARKRLDVEAIRVAAAAGNHKALSDLGHKIKGEGGSYGLDRISEIGANLELAAKAQDAAEVQRQAEALEEFLDAVEIVYD